MKLFITLTFILLTSVTHAYSTFGTDGDCDFTPNQLQDQLSNSLQMEYRLTNQQVFNSITLNGETTLHIKGGYDTCALAQSDTLSATNTTISGNNTTRVISVSTVSNLILENLNIINGLASDVSFRYGGGLYISANTTNNSVTLNNIEIHDNFALSGGGGVRIIGSIGFEGNFNNVNIHHNSSNENGGGLSFSGIGTLTLNNSIIDSNNANKGAGIYTHNNSGNTPLTVELNINDTIISNNTASNSGGGIWCEFIKINIEGDSAISSNYANNGGGVFLFNGCPMVSRSGDNLDYNSAIYGILNNTALNNGAGVYLSHNSHFNLIGDASQFANIIGNSTQSIDSKGGGIYVTDSGSNVHIINGRISNNNSNSGTAAYVNNQAKLHMRRSSGSCFGNQLCSEVSYNTTLVNNSGATFATNNCGSLEIYQTQINNNSATNGIAIASLTGNDSVNCLSVFEGNTMTNNTGDKLFYLSHDYQLDFSFNTLTENNTQTIFDLSNLGENQLNLTNSIIWNTPSTVIDTHSNALNLIVGNCIDIHDSSTLPNDFGNLVVNNNPEFAVGTYALSLASPLIDLCNTSLYQPQFHDIEGKIRGYNHPLVPIVLGPYDLGAFEFNPDGLNDVIYQDGF